MTIEISQEAIRDLLFRLADDELMIGHRNSEWTGVAPMLEEDIAFSSMAQDELGHAQAYYTILHEHFGEDGPDKLAFLRDATTFRNARMTALPRGDWADALMRQFFYDTAEHVRLEHYLEHPFVPLAQFVRKIHGEEKYHFLHARTWIFKLGNASEDSHARMQSALETLWADALGLFEAGQPDHPAPFDEASLRGEWLNFICPMLLEAGLNPLATEHDGQWQSTVDPIYARYSAPSDERIELLDAMQVVYRIDPEAEW